MTSKALGLFLLLAAVAGCDSHNGFSSAATAGARGFTRIALEADLVRPRFPTAEGNFFAFESRQQFFEGRSPFFLFDSVYVGQTETQDSELISVPADGLDEFANGDSRNGSMSASARVVAFLSQANNLVASPPTTFGRWQLYVRNRITGQTVLASRGADGLEANDDVQLAMLSSDGRFVVWASQATNIAPDLMPAGTSGRGLTQLYIFDIALAQNRLLTRSNDGWAANGHSSNPYITFDGRFVVFCSDASDLANPPSFTVTDFNNRTDIYLIDRTQLKAFRITNNTSIPGDALFDCETPVCSANGQIVVFSARDTTGVQQVFAFDRSQPATPPVRVSVTAAGAPGNGNSSHPTISPDGRYIAYQTDATNIKASDTAGFTDIIVFDRVTNGVRVLTVAQDPTAPTGTEANGDSRRPSFNGLGTEIAFSTFATNLVTLTQPQDPIETAFEDILVLPNPFVVP